MYPNRSLKYINIIQICHVRGKCWTQLYENIDTILFYKVTTYINILSIKMAVVLESYPGAKLANKQVEYNENARIYKCQPLEEPFIIFRKMHGERSSNTFLP